MKDNYDFWSEHDDRQSKQMAKLPVCSICKEPIQDDACYKIEGKLYCDNCLYENFRVFVDDLIE